MIRLADLFHIIFTKRTKKHPIVKQREFKRPLIELLEDRITPATGPVIGSISFDHSPVYTNDDLQVQIANITDADGNPYSVGSFNLSFHYVWRVNGAVVRDGWSANVTTDTLPWNLNGNKGDTIQITASAMDTNGVTGDPISTSIMVTNSPPVIDSVTLDNQSPKTNDLLTATVSASDDDGDSLTYQYTWKVNGEIVAVNTSSDTTNSLDLSQVGNGDKGDTVQVVVVATDGTDNSNSMADTATVVNSAPVVVDSSLAVTHDQPLPIDLSVLATDADGEQLQFTIVSNPTNNCTVTPNGDGTFTFQPAALWAGQSTFTFKANDGTDDSNIATITVDVINNAPVGTDSYFTVDPCSSLTISGDITTSANYDVDGDATSAQYYVNSGPSLGTLVYFNADGSFKYIPDANVTSGVDQFQYTISDGVAISQPVTVFITIQAGPSVNIVNTRGDDFVVSARDPNDIASIPGGIKQLWVRVNGNDDATFTITTTMGTGSAYLGRAPFPSMTVSGGGSWQLITIVGGDVSSQPGNMSLTATIGGNLMATWTFTVFTASLQAITAGTIAVEIPNSVENADHTKLNSNDPAWMWRGETLLGHRHREDMDMGNIVIRADISPAGMNPQDFNRAHDRNNSFNFDRRMSSRFYQDGPGLTEWPNGQPVDFLLNVDDAMDDKSDIDEDLTPRVDLPAPSTTLNLWVIDSPNATPDRIQANGAWQSVRIQFAEFLKYAGVLICPKVDWYWASSQIRQNGSFNEWSQSAGDNQVGVGTINLTVALAPTNVPAFTVASLQTTQALSYATFNVQFTITGTGLDAGGAANAQQLTKAYLYQDNMTDAQDGFRNFIVLNIDPGQTATTITGTLSVPNFAGFGFPPGRYSPTGWKLVVMIGGQSFTLPNAITINE